ncbi:MAG: T9SS type A sorting domain-containing protein, partial [Fidelibacterota bacterium]
ARFTSNPTGTAYFDDFTVNKMVLSGTAPVAIEYDDAEIELPEEYQLAQNYPNPFNPSTTVSFSVKEQSSVNISIYNMLGQKIRTLVDAPYAQGYYNKVWNATDDTGSPVSTGIYIYVMTVGDKHFTRKMVFLK